MNLRVLLSFVSLKSAISGFSCSVNLCRKYCLYVEIIELVLTADFPFALWMFLMISLLVPNKFANEFCGFMLLLNILDFCCLCSSNLFFLFSKGVFSLIYCSHPRYEAGWPNFLLVRRILPYRYFQSFFLI